MINRYYLERQSKIDFLSYVGMQKAAEKLASAIAKDVSLLNKYDNLF